MRPERTEHLEIGQQPNAARPDRHADAPVTWRCDNCSTVNADRRRRCSDPSVKPVPLYSRQAGSSSLSTWRYMPSAPKALAQPASMARMLRAAPRPRACGRVAMPKTPAQPPSTTARPTATTSSSSTALAYALRWLTRASTSHSTRGSPPWSETACHTFSHAGVGLWCSRTSGPSARTRAWTSAVEATCKDIGPSQR